MEYLHEVPVVSRSYNLATVPELTLAQPVRHPVDFLDTLSASSVAVSGGGGGGTNSESQCLYVPARAKVLVIDKPAVRALQPRVARARPGVRTLTFSDGRK